MEAYVFDKELNPLGVLNAVSDLMWQTCYNTEGKFELWCAMTADNRSILEKDNVVSLDEDPESAGIIELVNLVNGSDGLKKLHIAGRTCEAYLDFRVVYPVFIATGYVEDVIYSLLSLHVTNPTDTNRKFSNIIVTQTSFDITSITYQQTGKTVLESVSDLCAMGSFRFKLRLVREEKKFYFQLASTADRTIDQAVNLPVYLSSELDDILESEYVLNTTDSKNVAVIAGEDTATVRKYTVTGETTAQGVDRRELFVDARDIQSETDTGIATEQEYEDMLVSRGLSKLEDYRAVEEFNAVIRSYDNSYEYGEDFFLGDTVTVYDGVLLIRTNAVVTSTTLEYDSNGKRREFSFGYSQPTLEQKINRR